MRSTAVRESRECFDRLFRLHSGHVSTVDTGSAILK